MTRRRTPAATRFLLTLLVTLGLALAACGGGDDGDDGPPPKKAAEPAKAPATTVSPAGTSTEVGALPQGIAYDARTKALAVAVRKPYRLLVLDPDTLEQRFSVQLPGKVRHLQVVPGGGTVLVPSETANTVFAVDLRTGRTQATKVQRHPHDAAGADNGDLLVGNEFSGSMSVVRDGKVIHTFGDLTQPGGVVTDGPLVAAVDVRDYSVTTYDLRSLKRVARVPAGAGPTHGVLAAPGRLAVSDTRGNALLVYRLDPLRRIARLSLPGSPYGLTADVENGVVWVTLTGRNQVVGVDVSGAKPKVVARYPTVRQPDTVAVAPGGRTLWVTGTADGVVQRIER